MKKFTNIVVLSFLLLAGLGFIGEKAQASCGNRYNNCQTDFYDRCGNCNSYGGGYGNRDNYGPYSYDSYGCTSRCNQGYGNYSNYSGYENDYYDDGYYDDYYGGGYYDDYYMDGYYDDYSYGYSGGGSDFSNIIFSLFSNQNNYYDYDDYDNQYYDNGYYDDYYGY